MGQAGISSELQLPSAHICDSHLRGELQTPPGGTASRVTRWVGPLGPGAGIAELGAAGAPPTNHCPTLAAALHQPPEPASSCPHESHQPIEGRSDHGDGRERCLLRPLRLQCQRRGAFKGHFWLGRPARPQIQNKNRSGAPDGLAAPAPQNGLSEPMRRAARGRTRQGTPVSRTVRPRVGTWTGTQRQPAKWALEPPPGGTPALSIGRRKLTNWSLRE